MSASETIHATCTYLKVMQTILQAGSEVQFMFLHLQVMLVELTLTATAVDLSALLLTLVVLTVNTAKVVEMPALATTSATLHLLQQQLMLQF